MSTTTGKVIDDDTAGTISESETTATESADADPTEGDVAESTPSSGDPHPATTPTSARRAVPRISRLPRISGRPRTAIRRALPTALALLIIGLTGATVYLGWQYHRVRAVDAAGEAAQRAATSYAVTLTSVDTANLDANFQAVLDGSTGDFRDTYTKSSAQLRQLLIDHKATGHGVVLQSAVQSASTDEVVVLLFVDQTVTNTEMPDPRVDRSRIAMTMRQVDGRWKAAKVDIP
ncbi:DUF3329 domain-containing protein [Nocardia sp. NPDC058058]|uniref:DUF3329 domain-containing protein n=1 Tax=Nocardia sp. NPDC058058 TaxID=3346317 RepID=UPI0036D8E0A6